MRFLLHYITLILFCAVIVGGYYLSEVAGRWTVLGLTFGAGTLATALMLPLRDLIQEDIGRRMALVSIVIASILTYVLVLDDNLFYEELSPTRVVLSLIAALVWTELVDFGVYTYFRKFGWLVGMVVSDIVAAPILPLLFVYLITGTLATLPQGQVPAKLLILVPVWVFLAVTNIPTRMTNYPAIIWRGEAKWIRE